MKFKLIILFTILTLQIMAQKDRFFASEQAIEWVPQLVANNIQIIGQKNDKGIKSTDKYLIEFLFMTDKEEKAKSLEKAIKEKYKYRVYKLYSLEGFWVITGVTDSLSMQFDSFTKWTYEFCKFGFDEDTKLLNWNILNSQKAEQIDKFWKWFEENQNRYYENIEPDKRKEMEKLFDDLQKQLKPINSNLVFEFSPILGNKKREFVLSSDGRKEAFPDLISLYKRSPYSNKWEFILFKQGFDTDPKLKLTNDFTLSWDKVKFSYKELKEGLSMDFYIEGYNEKDESFGTGLIILLDSLLGEYDAVMQITYVDVHKLEKKTDKKLKEFKELKRVVEEYKSKKNKK